MFLQKILLDNFLSYGEASQAIELGKLTILIGPNGSGKSNLLEAVEILRNTPGQVQKPIREGGGIREWFNKNRESSEATISVGVTAQKMELLYYTLKFSEVANQFEIASEQICSETQTLYSYITGSANVAQVNSENILFASGLLSSTKSVLSQLRDPKQYPELTALADNFEKIRIYRDWEFGRKALCRQPQKADLPNTWLEPDASNLALILSKLSEDRKIKGQLLSALQKLYSGIEDYGVSVEGGTVQVFFIEQDNKIPASRLSDGTLRFLCLLSVLLHPSPPPLVCIEEPELGLHPDIIPALAQLLIEASERMQLVVTTHSDILIDAMTDAPESVFACERHTEGTVVQRLDKATLQPFLEDYRLGQLWLSGQLGGTRW